MSEIILPAMYMGRKAGIMRIIPFGIKTSFTVRCAAVSGGGILRAWAVFEGARLLIGVMQPLDGGLFVSRSFSRLELKNSGGDIGGALKAEISCAGDEGQTQRRPRPDSETHGLPLDEGTYGWRRFDPAEIKTADAALALILKNASGILCRKISGGLVMAAPFRRGKPFVFAPFFCLIRPVSISGETYGALTVDENGEICGTDQEL